VTDQAGYDPERVIADLGQQLGAAAAENARLRAAVSALLAERNEQTRNGESAAEQPGE
jgi:hypothetical protein